MPAVETTTIDANKQPPHPSGSTKRGGSSLTRRDFFAEVVVELRRLLPQELARFRQRANSSLLKLDFGNERVHYEVWADSMRQQIEIGLHFEDGPVSTAAYLALFDTHIVEIKHHLGAEIELERWTASWGHLFAIMPLARLDARLVDEVARRLAALIEVTHPLVAASAIPPERSAEPAERRGPWRKWRR